MKCNHPRSGFELASLCPFPTTITIVVYSYADSCRKIHNDKWQAFFKKYISHFIVTFACKRELVTEQRLQYIDPHSYGYQRCVFHVLLILNRRPRGPLCWLSLLHLITNWSDSQTPSGVPRAPSAGYGFPYHISSLTRLISNSIGGSKGPLCRAVAFSTTSRPQLTGFLSTPSYIIVQSPTQSLEWHVWSSSSGNNCHAVQNPSLFRCISLWVYNGLLPCPISSAKSAYAISFDYWPLECVVSFRCITLEWHVCKCYFWLSAICMCVSYHIHLLTYTPVFVG